MAPVPSVGVPSLLPAKASTPRTPGTITRDFNPWILERQNIQVTVMADVEQGKAVMRAAMNIPAVSATLLSVQ